MALTLVDYLKERQSAKVLNFLTANLAWQEASPLEMDLKELIKKEPWFKLMNDATTKQDEDKKSDARS